MINKEKGVDLSASVLIFFLALAILFLIILVPLVFIIPVVLTLGKTIRFKPGGRQEMSYNPTTLYRIPLKSGQVYIGYHLREGNGLLHFQEPNGTWQTIRIELVWMDRIRPSTF